VIAAAAVAGNTAWADRIAGARAMRPGAVGPGGVVNLPYFQQDVSGNQWRIYQGGWVQQQGNQALYSQGAQLTINGNQPSMNNNQARLDEKTGELVLENMNAQGLLVTRRILIDKEQSLVRYIDVIKNTGNQPVTAQVQCRATSTTASTPPRACPTPSARARSSRGSRRRRRARRWSRSSPARAPRARSRSRRSRRTASSGDDQPDDPGRQGGRADAPARDRPDTDAGVELVRGLKESQLLRSIPRDIRKLIVNFATGQNFIGDVEILRGDLLDVVELRGGDQVKGTLREKTFALETFYGKVELPVEQVIGLINVGRFRPRSS
jgi:hypothetical protein